MANRFRREAGLIVAWLVFPLVPVVLEDLYYQSCNNANGGQSSFGPDPRTWPWLTWVIMVGPLLGYSFLAGATSDIPDESGTSRRLLSRLVRKRAVWVAMGPWYGFLICAGIFFGFIFLAQRAPSLWNIDLPRALKGTWVEPAIGWIFGVLLVATLAYGWLWTAWASLRRAARISRLGHAFYRGMAVALGFLGSLFGSFWAATSWWRSYFFDPRAVPAIIAVVVLGTACGCGQTLTYGELRRRELFHAMLVAWVLGLALMWRWWSRPRRRPPEVDHAP